MLFVPGRMKSRVGLSNVSKLPNVITCRKHCANEARTRLVWLASAVLRQQYTNTPHRPVLHTDHTNSPTVFTQISIVTERQRDGRNSSIICSPRYSSVAKSTFQYIYGYSRTYTCPLNT